MTTSDSQQQKPEPDWSKVTIENTEPDRLRIVFPNDFSYVRGVRRRCMDFVAERINDEHTLFQLEILIDEVANNAIEHGSSVLKHSPVTIEVSRDGEDISVRVEDKGRGCSSESELGSDFSEEEIVRRREIFDELGQIRRGRGLLLVRELSKDFDLKLDPENGSYIEFVVGPKSDDA